MLNNSSYGAGAQAPASSNEEPGSFASPSAGVQGLAYEDVVDLKLLND